MPEPTVPDVIAPTADRVPPPPLPSDPDLRPIDLAASSQPDHLDEGARARLARAGQDALDACLRRFAPEERAAIWRAICRCYNRPYNPVDAMPVEVMSADVVLPGEAAPVAEIAPLAAPGVPDPHVIDAVRPVAEGAGPDAVLR